MPDAHTEALEAGAEPERQPFYVHCRDCNHEWVSFYLPLTMDKKGMRLLKAAGKSPCPMCAGTSVFVGRAKTHGGEG